MTTPTTIEGRHRPADPERRLARMAPAPRTDWHPQAACRDVPDPETFFPDGRGIEATAPALRICYACPVALACLDDAIRTDDIHHGIRGGKTPAERRVLAALRVGAAATGGGR